MAWPRLLSAGRHHRCSEKRKRRASAPVAEFCGLQGGTQRPRHALPGLRLGKIGRLLKASLIAAALHAFAWRPDRGRWHGRDMSIAVSATRPIDPDEPAKPLVDTSKPAKSGFGRKQLLLLGVPVVLAALGAGLWFGGVLPRLIGIVKPGAAAADGHAAGAAVDAKA